MKKHLLYLRYLLRHKWFVFQACRILHVPFWRAVIHDWSKFLPSEWSPYVRYFYGLPQVGDVVMVRCFDGFGGEARIVEARRSESSRYKVQMLDGNPAEPFWAHDPEVDGLELAKLTFNWAWNHHQKRQPHHWQYWLLTNDSGETISLDMPDVFIREMVADWLGAGRAITGQHEVWDWYEKNKAKMALSDATRTRVEELLDEAWLALRDRRNER